MSAAQIASAVLDAMDVRSAEPATYGRILDNSS